MSMKIPEVKKVANPPYNALVKLLYDKQFSGYLNYLEKVYAEKHNPVELRLILEKYLKVKKISLTWLDPLVTFIKNGNVDLPLDEGIALRIGNFEITENTQSILITRDNKTGVIVDPCELSIVVTAKTSTDKLKKFIEKNRDEIEKWQKVIELPEVERPSWKHINWALEIIKLHDEEGKTFNEVSILISGSESLQEEDINYLSDINNITSLYNRFKKRLA